MTLLIHEHTKNILDKLFGLMKTNNKVSHPFLLIHGPKNMGKSTMLQEYLTDLLGDYKRNDLLHIQDFSDEIGKIHTLRVEFKKNEASDNLAKEYSYDDKGSREIKEWMSRSPLSEFKIVLLENIERMTVSSANALLKLIEEPGEGRLIVATTSSLGKLLDTIQSRALLIKANLPDVDKLSKWLTTQISDLKPANADIIARLSHGRVGFAYNMANVLSEEKGNGLLNKWKEYKKQEIEGFTNKVTLSKLFVEINKAGILKDFLNLMHYDAVEREDFFLNEQIVQTKQYIERNVNADAAMMGLVNSLHSS